MQKASEQSVGIQREATAQKSNHNHFHAIYKNARLHDQTNTDAQFTTRSWIAVGHQKHILEAIKELLTSTKLYLSTTAKMIMCAKIQRSKI